MFQVTPRSKLPRLTLCVVLVWYCWRPNTHVNVSFRWRHHANLCFSPLQRGTLWRYDFVEWLGAYFPGYTCESCIIVCWVNLQFACNYCSANFNTKNGKGKDRSTLASFPGYVGPQIITLKRDWQTKNLWANLRKTLMTSHWILVRAFQLEGDAH